jgi:hypothetical protein
MGDLLGHRIVVPPLVRSVSLPLKAEGRVLEDVFLPELILRGMDSQLVAEIGERHTLQEVAPDNRYFLFRRQQLSIRHGVDPFGRC